ncbi:suppressor of SWI4 1 homolog [Protopterus annectens]|uniref:suppressor of SWI4 1 homolog n=1 Tax=Protopterus annectens TaxID=7888 RepID=UPI001CFA6647|nr:suppressor of SWI4 1 homolog [Protopterus annectens]
MGWKSKTKGQKKARSRAIHLAKEEFSSVPHSFVFHRGPIGKNVHQLILDVRRVMEPYTAVSLKVCKKNTLKDFVSVAGPLGITHFMMFTKTSTGVNFKLARLPRGPTLSFKVLQYCLIKDVVSSLKKHRMHQQQFTHHPLLILNNFGMEGMHIKVMSTMFQNLFPYINVNKTNLNTIKRCLLINHNPDLQQIDFRHYSIKVVPVGMSKGVKKLLQEKFPNMSRFEDISELLNSLVTRKRVVWGGLFVLLDTLQIGPRMTLQLVKIEEGLSEGNILYHSFVQKTEEELKMILKRKEKKLKLKMERRKKQESDIQRKKEEREAHRKKTLEGMKRTAEQDEEDSGAEDPGLSDHAHPDETEEAEVEYYRQEVGKEPDEGMFLGAGKRKRSEKPHIPKKFKKPKVAGGKRVYPSSAGQSPIHKGKNTKLLKKQCAASQKFRKTTDPHFKRAVSSRFKQTANIKLKGSAKLKFRRSANPKKSSNQKFAAHTTSELKRYANRKFKRPANQKLKGHKKGKRTINSSSGLKQDQQKTRASQQ